MTKIGTITNRYGAEFDVFQEGALFAAASKDADIPDNEVQSTDATKRGFLPFFSLNAYDSKVRKQIEGLLHKEEGKG